MFIAQTPTFKRTFKNYQRSNTGTIFKKSLENLDDAAAGEEVDLLPKKDTILEARWKSGTDSEISGWYNAVVLSRDTKSRRPTFCLRYEDGTIDKAVPIANVRPKLEPKNVLGRRVRLSVPGYGTIFGVVINADMLRDMYTIQFPSGDEEFVTGDEVREMMCEKATRENIAEIMSIRNISCEKLARLSSVGKKPLELDRWLSGEAEANETLKRALTKWYRTCPMTSRRNPRGKVKVSSSSHSQNYYSVAEVYYGRFWPEYEDDEEEILHCI